MDAGLLVVVIEADERLGRFYGTSLAAAGHRTLLATDGQAGLQAVVESHPDLVLVGSGLAPEDALAVLAVLRAGPRTAGVAAVLVAPGEDPELRRRALALGADEVVMRGFLTPAALARRVPQWLLARSREATARRRLKAV